MDPFHLEMMVGNEFVQLLQVGDWPVAPIFLGDKKMLEIRNPFSIPVSTGEIAPFNNICLISVSRDSVSSLEN